MVSGLPERNIQESLKEIALMLGQNFGHNGAMVSSELEIPEEISVYRDF